MRAACETIETAFSRPAFFFAFSFYLFPEDSTVKWKLAIDGRYILSRVARELDL